MGKLTIANLKKTIYYLQRNGIRNTWNAAWERLSDKEKYQAEFLTRQQCEELSEQALEQIKDLKDMGKEPPFFSVLVPAYQTDPGFLRELLQSMKDQVYPLWELLVLDASKDGIVRKTLQEVCGELDLVLYNGTEGLNDAGYGVISEGVPGAGGGMLSDGMDGVRAAYESVVRYISLSKNEGISENTNAGFSFAKGNYLGLLDHDDVLTPDALYEVAKAIWRPWEISGEKSPLVLYSDEDKWDGADQYYELNRKEDFNLDLILSNNYICHFMVLEESLFRELKLRKEYDGAQDYDLVLRAAAKILERGGIPEEEICHIPRVLYHWRCHSASTAENPRSKTYAYEAGRRALEDFAKGQGWDVTVKDLKHVGFYRMEYENLQETLRQRTDLGAIGGKIVSGGVLTGGRMADDGSVYYEGLKEGYSGYLHRAVLTQDAEAVDLRCIAVQKEFWPLFEEVLGIPYVIKEETSCVFDPATLPKDANIREMSVRFCTALREQGKRILWDPEWSVS